MATIYVSTDGSDSNSGSQSNPLASPQAGIDEAGPGDEVIVEPGTYEMSSGLRLTTPGESGNRVTFRARNDAAFGTGDRTVFRFSGNDSAGVQIRAPYVDVRGFEIDGSDYKGIVFEDGPHDPDHSTVSNVDVHDCHLWGVMTNAGQGMTVRDSVSHHNDGDPGNSDGFNGTGSQNCRFVNLRAWANGDDGYDMWSGNDHYLRGCWAWNNGHNGGDGNGFKLGNQSGGGGHRVERCVAYDNSSTGFDFNGTTDPDEVVHCTALNNGTNFHFGWANHYLANNISAGSGGERVDGQVTQEANSWNLDAGDPGFRSTDPDSDDFLRLASSSACIDAGVDVDLAYSGDAPDLGAFEYGESGSGSSSGSGGSAGSTSERLTVDGETTVYATDALTNDGSSVETEHSGFKESGYVNFEPDSGAYARWELDVATADTYGYQIRYANGDSSDRTAVLTAAGTQQDVTFPQTGDWASWSTVAGTVELPSGAVDLTVQTVGQDSGNVDQIALWPKQDQSSGSGSGADDSRAEPTGDTPNHGYATPEQGATDWHVPINENFQAIDRDVPIVDTDAAKSEYAPADRALYVATDTGTLYVGDGSQWTELGSLN